MCLHKNTVTHSEKNLIPSHGTVSQFFIDKFDILAQRIRHINSYVHVLGQRRSENRYLLTSIGFNDMNASL